MPNFVSPNFDESKLSNPTIDDLIDVFDDRMKGWFVAPARKLLTTFSDFAASLCLQMTYFEGVWSYMTGLPSNNRSKEFFREGFLDVFRAYGSADLLRKAADVLYEDARCGFFHDGMFRDRVFFGTQGPALQVTLPKKAGQLDLTADIESILIDPRQFLSTIEKHSNDFVATLRQTSNAEKRASFQTTFRLRQGRARVIGMDDPTTIAK
jgi:hypothetical protein